MLINKVTIFGFWKDFVINFIYKVCISQVLSGNRCTFRKGNWSEFNEEIIFKLEKFMRINKRSTPGIQSVTIIGPEWESTWNTFCTVGKDVGIGGGPPDRSCGLGERNAATTNLLQLRENGELNKFDIFLFLLCQCPATPLAKHDWKSEGKKNWAVAAHRS